MMYTFDYFGYIMFRFTNTLLVIKVEGVARRADTNIRALYVNTSPIGTVVTVTVAFINIYGN